MRVLTIFRAMAWFGVIVVFWSLNVRWGADLNLPNGPPNHSHKAVVGAGLLALIAALALSVSGRGGNPPSWIARGIAGVASLIIIAIVWSLYSKASDPTYAEMIGGTGWTWLAGGGGMIASAVIGTLGLQKVPEKQDNKSRKKGSKGHKRR